MMIRILSLRKQTPVSGGGGPTTKKVSAISVTPKTMILGVGGTGTITATVEPGNATNKTVTWTSSDVDVATVNNGVVTAKAAGMATITATAGGKTDTCTVNVFAESSADDFDFNEETKTITGYKGSGGVVVIPSKINSVDVETIGENAFIYCTDITNIVIPNGVTSIGEGAFWYCENLTNITIPNSVTLIGDYAFDDCARLQSINVDGSNAAYSSVDGVLYDKAKPTLLIYPAGKTDTTFVIPNSVTSIGEYAFSLCESLTSITIPNSVTSIGEGAFDCCIGLESITIPDSVGTIGDYVFYDCTSLTSITIPNSITTIGYSVFKSCTGLTSVTIPDSVTNIGNDAFYGCENLTSITIPASVNCIGEDPFDGCIRLQSIIVDGSNTVYSSVDGVLFNKAQTELIRCPQGKGGSYTIPSGVTSIWDYAFFECENLTSLIIPDSVTTIGDYAFYGCTDLKSITIGAGVTIGDYLLGHGNDKFRTAYDVGGAGTYTADTYGGEWTKVEPEVIFTFTGLDAVTAGTVDFSITTKVTNNDAIANGTPLRYKAVVTKDGPALAGQIIKYPEAGDTLEDPNTWHSFTTDSNGTAYFGPSTGFTLTQLPALLSAEGVTTPFQADFAAGSYSVTVSLLDISDSGEVVLDSGTEEFSVAETTP
jgi:hypothetical protein